MLKTLSISERVSSLQNLFTSFGIPILPNSSLDHAIKAEFAAGNRSKITPLLLELRQESDACRMAVSIGAELAHTSKDPQVLAVAKVLQERLPPVLAILDVRNSIAKREQILAQLLDHFICKIPKTNETQHMLRMLYAAKQNLLSKVQVNAIANVVDNIGATCKVRDLQRFSKVLQAISPALIAIDQADFPIEQKINLSVYGLRSLAVELRATKLQQSVDVLESVQWLAKVSLPLLSSPSTVEQGLQKLGISLGATTTKFLCEKARLAGVSQPEILQMIYSAANPNQLNTAELHLLNLTQQNQQYGAICGFVAKLAHDLKQTELKKIAVAGVCLAILRQTYCELKTNNLHSANFSESLGTILLGAGDITDNKTLAHLGKSILTGVQAYSGVMAVPGGASIAVPLAVCSVLGKLFLEPAQEEVDSTQQTAEVLSYVVQNICMLQQQMRSEFAHIYHELYAMQTNLLAAMDQGFTNLDYMTRYNNLQILNNMRKSDEKLDNLQLQINQEFADLYLDKIRQPLEEIVFANCYGEHDTEKMRKNKEQLGLWLVFRSKNPKITGAGLGYDQISALCSKVKHSDEVLGLINRYVNTHFAQELPEDLPHIPTWLSAAHAYVNASDKDNAIDAKEAKLLTDIIAVGKQPLQFAQNLHENTNLWQQLQSSIQQCLRVIQTRWTLQKLQINTSILQSMDHTVNMPLTTDWLAHSAATQQLEPFTPVQVDISPILDEQLQQLIPYEFQAAVACGLGKWQINFTIDKSVNNFADIHIAYGNHSLPSHARDVLFKVEVHYVPNSANPQLLTTTWLAYDLGDARRRFDEYYLQKFKHGLKHNRYNWISLDGLTNHVEGHANTATKKLIDYDRLGNTYKQWLLHATPINKPEVLARIKNNSAFKAQYGELLESGSCTITQTDEITFMRLVLFNELRTEAHKRRIIFAAALEQDAVLKTAIEKLELYISIATVYTRILNLPFSATKYYSSYNNLLKQLQQTEDLKIDLLAQFDELFNLPCILPTANKEYLTGDFYLKMQAAITRLNLLQTNVVVDRLRFAS